MLVTAALGAITASCTDDPGRSDAAATDDPTTVPAPEAAPAADGGVPLPTLAPVSDRVVYTSVPTPPPVPPAAADDESRREALLAERPPADVADDRFVRAPDATPVRWMELTVDVVRRRALNPTRATRATALVAVASNDAALAAVRSGTLPTEVAAAGAADRVATKLFPSEGARFDALGLLARQRAAGDPGTAVGTIDAAWTYGASIGDAVLARAATDGATPWTGQPPTPAEPGGWVPTPGMFAPALEPFAGTWAPWHLARGDEFRPPPPPSGADLSAAAAQVKQLGTNIDDSELRICRFWELGPGSSTPPGYWLNDVAAEALRPYTVEDQAGALATLATALHDATIATWDAKYHYFLVRPVTVIQKEGTPGWLPTLATPPFPAYVSGHSTYSATAAVVLASLLPERADEFLDAAAEAGDSRVSGGIHYWFDNLEGARLGERLGTRATEATGIGTTALPGPSTRLRLGSPDAGTA